MLHTIRKVQNMTETDLGEMDIRDAVLDTIGRDIVQVVFDPEQNWYKILFFDHRFSVIKTVIIYQEERA